MNGKFLIIFVIIKMEKKVDYHRMNYKQVYSQIFFYNTFLYFNFFSN